jgi:hypothetical protein
MEVAPMTTTDVAAWIEGLIREVCNGPENTLRGGFAERAWGEPLIGFAAGDDPLFDAYKEHVGPFHWTPSQALALAYPDLDVAAGEVTVISWVLPQTTATKLDSRRETYFPPERWARSRIYGEEFNDHLRRQVVAALKAAGHPAVAPMIASQFKTHASERFTWASTWSERHVAHAAGLGTFGLCDGLITPVGKAMRVGSVVAQLQIEPTPRPYADHHAYCLFYANGTCGECITRCPVGALSEAGHDKVKCSAHLGVTRAFVKDSFGFAGYGCGLCQTGVPCESGIPEGIIR